MQSFRVVAQYRESPAEGIQVVSKNLVDELRGRGHPVSVVEPSRLISRLLLFFVAPTDVVVFTHGPGRGVVIVSWLLRHVTSSRIIWVATRPDLKNTPRILKHRRTAHGVVMNPGRRDVLRFTSGADVEEQFIGIDPARLTNVRALEHGAELRGKGVIRRALHVGHLKENRGLDLLAQLQREVGDDWQIVVQGSPTFVPEPGVVEELQAAGVLVDRDFVENLSEVYASADVYLFPVRPGDDAGAIDLPLSVVEAVACHLPVISTPFGSLPRALEGVRGVDFIPDAEFVAGTLALLSQQDYPSELPDGLPHRLHAERTIEAVLKLTASWS